MKFEWLEERKTKEKRKINSRCNNFVSPNNIVFFKNNIIQTHTLKYYSNLWRLFRDRLPTKDNLLRRGVINHDSQTCVAGCDLVESSSHLFLHCNILVQFGIRSTVGLVFQWPTPFQCPIILTSLATTVELGTSGVRCYRLFGMQQFGKSGRNETTGCLMAPKALFFKWLIG